MPGPSGAADGGKLEQREDLTAETDSFLKQAENLLSSSPTNLPEALTLLASIEKRLRMGNDTPNLVRVCEASIQHCHDAKDEERLIVTLNNLTTRRSQKSKAIGAMVTKAIAWVLISGDGKGYIPIAVETEEQKEILTKLVVALRDITDGKLFLEAERARLTRALAIIKEQEGDIPGAADILQEVHVETYGSLSKREKIEFILEQMRLTLGKKDYVRAAIVGNKINRKALHEEGMEAEKIKFFSLMAEYHRHEKDALELAKDYHAIYLTSTVQAVEEQWFEALRATVLFLTLSPYSSDQVDLLNRIKADSNLEKLEACSNAITLLLTKEIASYPILHQDEMETWNAFREGGDDLAMHWKKTFHTRIIQHNIRVVACYYKRIHGKRLSQLLGLTPAEVEKEVAGMVSNGDVYAKIDRPSDIFRFKQEKSPETILSSFAQDVSTLLNLVETTSHLIQKENMVQ